MPYPVSENKDYLHKTPNWIVRRGNFAIFLILLSALALSFLIKYNDTLSSEVLLTTQNPPVHILSKKTSRVTKVDLIAGQKVEPGQILAVLENTSDENDVYYLKSTLRDSVLETTTIQELFTYYPSDLKLETPIQTSYQNFISKFSQYILFNLLGQNKSETENINSRLKKTKNVVRNKQLQLGSLYGGLELSKKAYKRQQTLYSKGVISKQELDKFHRGYLDARAEYQNFKQELEQLYIDSLSLKNQGVKTSNMDIVNSTLYSSELSMAKQELLAKIDEWEDLNILKSPINGEVTIFDIWNKNQLVKEGEKVFTIIPTNDNNYVGKCKVPIRNSGKIKINQKVIIQLDNYPAREWGNIEGIVSSISEVPKEGRKSYYSVYVKIPDLTTSYGKKIAFRQEMYGTAKIILEETSLITRVFYQLRDFWSNARN